MSTDQLTMINRGWDQEPGQQGHRRLGLAHGRGPLARRRTDLGLGVVGMAQLAAHWWSATRTVPAAELVDQLTELAHGGLATLLPPR